MGRSIYGFRGNLLLARGKPLDEGFISRIGELRFPGVYVEVPGFEAVDPPEIVDASLRAQAQAVLEDSLETLTKLTPLIQEFDGELDKSLDTHPEFKRALPIGKIQNQVNRIIDDLMDQFATELPCLLLKAQSKYQVEHAMDTMILAILLGINFRFIYRELRQLGLAALLHDVGKTLLAEPGEQNIGPDHPRYKEHPLLGGMIVLSSGSNCYTECAAIQQHHERQDGSGFPHGLQGNGKSPASGRIYHRGTIYRLAEIISVADAYDVMTSGAFQPPISPEQAIQQLVDRCPSEFNTHTVKMLARVIQIFPIGCQVRIIKSSDEKLHQFRGIVSAANSDFPHRVELILTHDSSRKSISPTPVSLADDEEARIELVL